MIQYTHIFPPHIFTASDGHNYLLPMWRKLPKNITLTDIEWTNPYMAHDTILATVIGSKGDKYTITKHSNGTVTCDCAGGIQRKMQTHNTI